MLPRILKTGIKHRILAVGQQPSPLLPLPVGRSVIVCARRPSERIDPRITLQSAGMTLCHHPLQRIPSRVGAAPSAHKRAPRLCLRTIHHIGHPPHLKTHCRKIEPPAPVQQYTHLALLPLTHSRVSTLTRRPVYAPHRGNPHTAHLSLGRRGRRPDTDSQQQRRQQQRAQCAQRPIHTNFKHNQCKINTFFNNYRPHDWPFSQKMTNFAS